MRKLTQREKVLVYIAVVLLLLTGVYYLVKIPSDMKRVRTEAELKIIQLQERESENDLTGKSVLEQEIGREQGVIGENTEDYLPYRTNSMLIPELAEYLTSFEIVPETIEVLDVSVLETKEAAETGYNIHKATVHVEASGTMEDLYRLLDWAYDRDWISVTSYSRNSIEDEADGTEEMTDGNVNGETLSMTVTCLMLELKSSEEVKRSEEVKSSGEYSDMKIISEP